MDPRTFFRGVVAALAGPLGAGTQERRVPRIGVLSPASRRPSALLATAARARAGALFVIEEGTLVSHRADILSLAVQHRLPAASRFKDFADAGGLLSYGPSLPDLVRRSATYVDKILKGARPGDLPVEQPTRLELVINLKTAKAFGLTVPPSLLQRAYQVIE